MLTQDQFTKYKHDYTVYKPTKVKDEYSSVQNVYTEARGTINVMQSPLNDTASYQAYGADIYIMLQAVLYGDNEIERLDQIDINGIRYEVVTIQSWNNFRLLKVKKVTR